MAWGPLVWDRAMWRAGEGLKKDKMQKSNGNQGRDGDGKAESDHMCQDRGQMRVM